MCDFVETPFCGFVYLISSGNIYILFCTSYYKRVLTYIIDIFLSQANVVKVHQLSRAKTDTYASFGI